MTRVTRVDGCIGQRGDPIWTLRGIPVGPERQRTFLGKKDASISATDAIPVVSSDCDPVADPTPSVKLILRRRYLQRTSFGVGMFTASRAPIFVLLGMLVACLESADQCADWWRYADERTVSMTTTNQDGSARETTNWLVSVGEQGYRATRSSASYVGRPYAGFPEGRRFRGKSIEGDEPALFVAVLVDRS